MSLSSKKSRGLRTVMFESLQRRELMAADASLLFIGNDVRTFYGEGSTAEQWAERVLNSHEFSVSNWSLPASEPLKDIKKFGSEQEAQKYLTEALVKTWKDVLGKPLNNKLNAGFGYWVPDIEDAVLSGTSRGMADSYLLTTSNATNVQVRSVDEADQFEVSADGYIYALGAGMGAGSQQLKVFDARDPKNLRKVASIDIAGFNAQLHLVGEQLVLISSEFSHRSISDTKSEFDPISRIQVFGVSDPSKPTLQSNVTVTGVNQQSRVVDGMLTLLGNYSFAALRPQFISDDPTAVSHVLTDTPIGRFETVDEFSARIQPLVLDWVLPHVRMEGSDADLNLIDWSDLVASSNGDYRQQFSVTTFKLTDSGLELIDGETVLGPSTWGLYVDDNTVYASHALNSLQIIGDSPQVVPPRTEIFSIEFDAEGVDFVASGVIPGSIRDSRMMDEYQGNLRVFSDFRVWNADSELRASSDLYILKPNAGKFEIIGQLTDVADGQALYSAFFDEDQAMITTWVSEIPNQWALVRPSDPLHTFDLSDPTKPVELSELVIPGVSTYLQRVDSNHLVGIGYIDFGVGDWRQQISLYDVSDLTNPKVVDTWVSNSTFFSPNFRGSNQNALAVHFDSVSGLFSIAFSAFGSFSSPALGVFKIDSGHEDPLQFVGEIRDSESTPMRSTVIGNTLFVMSEVWLRAFGIDDISTELGRGLLTKPGVPDWMQSKEKETIELKLLANDYVTGGRIISISSELGVPLTILEDGVTVQYKAPEIGELFASDELTYTVELESGETYSSVASIQIYGDYEVGQPPGGVIYYEPVNLEPVVGGPVSVGPVSVGTGSPTETEKKVASVEYDISGDGVVSPLDALLVLEQLNQQSQRIFAGERLAALAATTSIFDLSGDGQLSPMDLFLVVQRLNSNATAMIASGEAADDFTAAETHIVDEALLSLFASNYADQDDFLARSKRSIARN